MIGLRDVEFRYGDSGFAMRVPEFSVSTGEKLAVIGPSGTGKSTLLKLIAGIMPAQGGQITVDGIDLQTLGDSARRNFRVRRVGFVFQELELLDYLSVYDNILHTYRINPVLKLDTAVRERAERLAEQTGLGSKLRQMPQSLSQGERQRAAVCRALLPEPAIILADEATGNLDPANKVRILDLLMDATVGGRASLIAVTHDHELLPRFDRVVDFRDFHA